MIGAQQIRADRQDGARGILQRDRIDVHERGVDGLVRRGIRVDEIVNHEVMERQTAARVGRVLQMNSVMDHPVAGTVRRSHGGDQCSVRQHERALSLCVFAQAGDGHFEIRIRGQPDRHRGNDRDERRDGASARGRGVELVLIVDDLRRVRHVRRIVNDRGDIEEHAHLELHGAGGAAAPDAFWQLVQRPLKHGLPAAAELRDGEARRRSLVAVTERAGWRDGSSHEIARAVVVVNGIQHGAEGHEIGDDRRGHVHS